MSEWLTGRGGREGGVVQGKGKEKEPGKAQSPEAASVSRLGVKLQQCTQHPEKPCPPQYQILTQDPQARLLDDDAPCSDDVPRSELGTSAGPSEYTSRGAI